jgi:hypothetical protein
MIDIYKVALCTAIQNIEYMPTHPVSSSYGQRRSYTACYAALARQYNRISYVFEVMINDI